MSAKTPALDRLMETIAPALAAELDRIVQETKDAQEQEFQARLQSAVRETEAAAAAATFAAQNDLERAVQEATHMATEETRRQTTVELEHQFAEKLNATTTQLKEEAATDRAKLEASMAEMKSEWSGELAKLEDDRDLWRTFAEAQRQLSEAASQPEILARFMKLSEPYADRLGLYVIKGDGLSLWKSKGKGAFPEIISKETTDPESYFRILSVRGKTVGAVCAAPAFKAQALEFLASCLERAIEVFGMNLKTPLPKAANTKS